MQLEVEIGALKIKDGFFIGDLYAAKDIEFVMLNKITRIINCSSLEIYNIFAEDGVQYMSFPWRDSQEETYIDAKEQIDTAVSFLNISLELGESILIHSIKCQNRAVFLCACYLIKHYRWSTETALSFIYCRKQVLPRMRNSVEKQLYQYEMLQRKTNPNLKSINWNREELLKVFPSLTPEEAVFANTFINSSIPVPAFKPAKKNDGKRVQWNDRVPVLSSTGKQIKSYCNKLCTTFEVNAQPMVTASRFLNTISIGNTAPVAGNFEIRGILKMENPNSANNNNSILNNGVDFPTAPKTQKKQGGVPQHPLSASMKQPLTQNLINAPLQYPQQRRSSKKNIIQESTASKSRHTASNIRNQEQDQNQFQNVVIMCSPISNKRNLSQKKQQENSLVYSYSGSSIMNRSTSKDKRYEQLIYSSTGKVHGLARDSKLTTLYAKMGLYGCKPEKSSYGPQNTSKLVKKSSTNSTKAMRPMSGPLRMVSSNNQIRSFMEGLNKMQNMESRN